MHGPSQPPAIRDGTREDQNPLGELSKESRFQVPTTEPKSAAGTPTTKKPARCWCSACTTPDARQTSATNGSRECTKGITGNGAMADERQEAKTGKNTSRCTQ